MTWSCFNHIDDEGGEISLCILSAINVGKLRGGLSELENLCDLAVRALDELIDYQAYAHLPQQPVLQQLLELLDHHYLKKMSNDVRTASR